MSEELTITGVEPAIGQHAFYKRMSKKFKVLPSTKLSEKKTSQPGGKIVKKTLGTPPKSVAVDNVESTEDLHLKELGISIY